MNEMICRNCKQESMELVHVYNHDIFRYKDYRCFICNLEALVWECGEISWYEPDDEGDND